MLVLGNSSTYSHHINYSGQDSVKFPFELHYFGPDSRLAQTKTAIPIRSVQNAHCRPGTKCRLRIHTVFSSGYVIICHLTTYRVSRNRFSATIFYDYLHYVEYSQPVSRSQTFLFQAWCLYRIHQLDKRGCRCK